uniref:Uncharacterized protein n=1 Tax=Lepeophtheirus salmonis TaxID=72036 RepID=A0A0K2U6U6_LEPSM
MEMLHGQHQRNIYFYLYPVLNALIFHVE